MVNERKCPVIDQLLCGVRAALCVCVLTLGPPCMCIYVSCACLFMTYVLACTHCSLLAPHEKPHVGLIPCGRPTVLKGTFYTENQHQKVPFNKAHLLCVLVLVVLPAQLRVLSKRPCFADVVVNTRIGVGQEHRVPVSVECPVHRHQPGTQLLLPRG